MKKKQSFKVERTSYYSKNRACYVNKDGDYEYSYLKLNDEGKYEMAKVVVETTKDNIDIIRKLDEMDNEEDRQEKRDHDHLAMEFVNNCRDENDDGEKFRETLIDMIADPRGDAFTQLYGDVCEEKDETKYKEFTNTLNEDQKMIIEEHVFNQKSFAVISKELKAKGISISPKALESRWEKIRRKVSKFYNIPLPPKKRVGKKVSSRR